MHFESQAGNVVLHHGLGHRRTRWRHHPKELPKDYSEDGGGGDGTHESEDGSWIGTPEAVNLTARPARPPRTTRPAADRGANYHQWVFRSNRGGRRASKATPGGGAVAAAPYLSPASVAADCGADRRSRRAARAHCEGDLWRTGGLIRHGAESALRFQVELYPITEKRAVGHPIDSDVGGVAAEPRFEPGHGEPSRLVVPPCRFAWVDRGTRRKPFQPLNPPSHDFTFAAAGMVTLFRCHRSSRRLAFAGHRPPSQWSLSIRQNPLIFQPLFAESVA